MLTSFAAVYVPSKIGQKVNAARHRHWKNEAMTKMAKLFGGATAYAVEGAWVSPTDGLVVENVVIVKSACSPQALKTMAVEVEALAASIAADMRQDAVAVETPRGLKFVEPTKVAAV